MFSISDRVKLYNHDLLNPSKGPEALQRKVQFDLRLYFCRRGMENMDKLKKKDFEVRFNTESEEWFVIKTKDELTKNHKEIEQIVSGIMPENKTDNLCPVKSFRTYIEHLNPDNDYMWQYALDRIDPTRPNIWYSKRHFGKNPLSTFMSDLSQKCNLSKNYTNHSIRVTGITVLTNAKFSNADIMSVSGHKSIQSLAVYQKTDNKKKMEMGKKLSESVVKTSDKMIEGTMKRALPPAPSTMQMAVQSETAITPTTSTAIVPFEPNFEEDDGIPDFDLLSALAEFERNNNANTPSTTVANTNVLKPDSKSTVRELPHRNY